MMRLPFDGWLANLSPETRKLWERRSPAVRRRIERLNPVVTEGQRMRGWNPHHRARDDAIMYGCVTVRLFIAKYGSAVYRSLPRNCIYKRGHRKLIKLTGITHAVQGMRAAATKAA